MARVLKNLIKTYSNELKDLYFINPMSDKTDVKYIKCVNSNGQSTIVYDTFKLYAYNSVNIDTFTYDDIPAKGGKVLPKLWYSQSDAEIGFSGESYSTSTNTSGATITYSGTGVNTVTGAVSATSVGANIKVRTKITTVTVTVTMNGKSVSKSVDVYQEANQLTGYSYDTPTVTFSSTVSAIPANGGTRTCPTATYLQIRRYNYTAGDDLKRDTVTNGGTVYYGTTINPSSLTDNTKVTITGNNLGVTEKAETIVGTFYAKVVINGKLNETSINVVQSKNEFTEYEYDEPTFTLGSVANIPAGGGTSSAPSVTNILLTRYYCFTSGHKLKSDTISPTAQNSATIYYGTTTNPTSTSTSSGTLKANSLGTTTTTVVTKIGTVYVKVLFNGKSSEKSTVVNQAVNTFTEYEYDNPVITLGSISDIPASGGTSSVPSVSYTQTRYYCYSSGHKLKSDTLSSGATIYYGTITSPTSTNPDNCKITVSSLGSLVRARTSVGSSYIKVSANGKSSEKSITVYQQANVENATSKITSYGNVICSATVNDIPASGGTVTVTRSAEQYKTRTYYFTSGAINETAFEACTVTWNSSDVTASATGLKTTEKARTAIKTFNYTVYGENNMSNTCSCTAYQAANVKTKNYGSVRSYGTPTITIGTGITAATSYASVSHGVVNSRYYYYTYTDTSANEGVTAHYEDVAGTTTISIDTNTSRFYLNGDYLNHSSMGTAVTTDSCTITAKNTGDTTKTATAKLNIENKVTSWSYTNIKCSLSYPLLEYTNKSTSTPTYSVTATGTPTYTSGSTGSAEANRNVTSSSTITFKKKASTISNASINESTGVLTALSQNNGSLRIGMEVVMTAVFNSTTVTAEAICYQKANPFMCTITFNGTITNTNKVSSAWSSWVYVSSTNVKPDAFDQDWVKISSGTLTGQQTTCNFGSYNITDGNMKYVWVAFSNNASSLSAGRYTISTAAPVSNGSTVAFDASIVIKSSSSMTCLITAGA